MKKYEVQYFLSFNRCLKNNWNWWWQKIVNIYKFSVHFIEKRMGQEVEGDCLGDEYKGYIFKITGGNDRDGFPMR